MSNPNGRNQERVDLKVAVRVQQYSRLQQFYSQNLSTGGIFLEVATRPPAIGSQLTLTFDIPALKRSVTVTAEVMHQHMFETMDDTFKKKVLRHGIGLKFLNLTPQDEEIIKNYIAGKDLRVNT